MLGDVARSSTKTMRFWCSMFIALKEKMDGIDKEETRNGVSIKRILSLFFGFMRRHMDCTRVTFHSIPFRTAPFPILITQSFMLVVVFAAWMNQAHKPHIQCSNLQSPRSL